MFLFFLAAAAAAAGKVTALAEFVLLSGGNKKCQEVSGGSGVWEVVQRWMEVVWKSAAWCLGSKHL